MGTVEQLKAEFDNAKRALIQNLFNLGEKAQVEAELDRMSRAFNELLISTLTDITEFPTQQSTQEFLCAYAVNTEPDETYSTWHIIFINGRAVPETDPPLSVREFTHQMVTQGWKVVNPQLLDAVNDLHTADGRTIYELYFFREHPSTISTSRRN